MRLLGIRERVQTLNFSLALPIDHQVACDGEQPSFKAGFSVVLMPTLQNTNPRFLEKIFSARAIASDVHEITKQPELILLDQPVQQIRVTPLQALRQCFVFVFYQRREGTGWKRTR